MGTSVSLCSQAEDEQALLVIGDINGVPEDAAVGRCKLTPGCLRADRAWWQRLEPNEYEPSSSVASSFNSRRYTAAVAGLAALREAAPGAVRPAAWLAEMVAAAAVGNKADPDAFDPESALGLGPGPAAVAAAAAAAAAAAEAAKAKAEAAAAAEGFPVAAAAEAEAVAAAGAGADVSCGDGGYADAADANAKEPETALAKATNKATTDATKALRAAGLTSAVVDTMRALRLARRLRALAPLCAAADLHRRLAVSALAAWSQATDGDAMDWAVAVGRATAAVSSVGNLEEAVAALQAGAYTRPLFGST